MATSAISGSSGAMAAWRTQRPDPAQVVDNLFSKIDTKNQGYIDKAELQTAFDQISANSNAGGTDSSSKVEAIFKKLDGNSDGKISKQELTSGMQKLVEQFDHQFNRARTHGADRGAPSADAIFSQIDTKNQGYIDKQELSAALNANNSASATGQAHSSRADQLFSKLDSNGDDQISKQELADGLKKTGAIQGQHRGPEGAHGPGHAAGAPPPPPPAGAGGADSDSSSTSTGTSASKVFAAADTNQDGTVSFQELIASQATQPDASTQAGAASQSDNSNASVMKMMMQLVQAYGFDQNPASSSSSAGTISATA